VLDDADWSVGYAPGDWNAMTRFLTRSGFSSQTLLAAGLTLIGRTGCIDRYCDRLVLPIRDTDGRVVSFIGRAHPSAPQRTPKYLNGPTTAVFRKGEALLGLVEQRQAIAAGATPVLVEGPLDALAVTVSGAGHYVGIATCGAALSRAQARQLLSVTAGRALVTAFDGDPAGYAAGERALRELVGFESVSAVTLPPGSDPADVLQNDGPRRLHGLLDGAGPLAEHLIDARLRAIGRPQWIEQRVHAARGLVPLLVQVPRGRRQAVAATIVERLDILGDTLTTLMNEPPAERFRFAGRRAPGVRASSCTPRR
jgi:DNA primase catalytic core